MRLYSHIYLSPYIIYSAERRGLEPQPLNSLTVFEAAPETLSGLRSIVHPRGVEPRIAGYKPVATNRITLGA